MGSSILKKNKYISGDHILIVDDDEINRGILDNIFCDYYIAEEAENGKIGLNKILDNPEKYCAILLDVMMPEMDGLEVLHHLKEAGLVKKIPVFMITAEANDNTIKEAYRLGVMDVILKPVVPYLVLRRVNSIVELFQVRKRLGNQVERQSLELLEKSQKIIELYQGMIEALSTAIEFRDGESGEHVSFC